MCLGRRMTDSASSINIYGKKMMRGVNTSSTGQALWLHPQKDSMCKNTTSKPHKCTILVPLSF